MSTATASRGATSEDRIFTTSRGDEIAVVLADGAGGRTGGAAAADAFCEAAKAWLARSRDWFDVRALSVVFTELDGRIFGEGETTAVVVIASPNAVAGVSAGDSEAWMIREGRIDDLTANRDAISRSCDSAESLVVLPKLPSGQYPDDVAVAVVR